MSTSPSLSQRDIYLSFFMFTTDLKPDNSEYRETVIKHIKELQKFGYTGFEFPIAPPPPESQNYAQDDLENYTQLRSYLDKEGLTEVKISTNVGATLSFDPSSPDPQQRQQALDYLKSRVDITAALRGNIMMGPIVIPYGLFPVTEPTEQPIWSDQLQDYLKGRYDNAKPILNQLGEYAEGKNVKLAIEPITHWETSGPNKLSQLIEFLKGVPSKQVGVVIDSAHETLDGDGPEIFKTQVDYLDQQKRLHYIQVSPPDRGAIHTSWLPWQSFLEPILKVYDGPIAVEIFNAIPAFTNSLRLTRRKFWIPGEDPENQYPSAYYIADQAIKVTQQEILKTVNSYR
ncbi:Xylose isomerase-like TIM barrel [Microcystis aeruginosa PCC 9807]|uniref:Xylose isomerase-like TIM barrel n=1 Tax=Microcystis aeruginosa PCC 9807 TaxID=1160283 RepID=I4H018_MICAE|nr:sugar phosphate isomerase/epimerase family protein [Microcystis aeruginosa]CCI15392.1 Xylose isomerase-like TIM barrel [Microcystis aeruginosa PCC 9807]